MVPRRPSLSRYVKSGLEYRPPALLCPTGRSSRIVRSDRSPGRAVQRAD
jgi:hypothetical protein